MINRVAVIGTGLIGTSWAAHFLAQGLDVVASDPDPAAEDRTRRSITGFWPALASLGLAEGASPDRLAFTRDWASAVDGADFVQENAPEVAETKQELMRGLDGVAADDVIIASSSSGLLPSFLQATAVRHPERILVGHPFNPPHLVPLVEVVGGERTSPAAVRRAADIYRSLNKRPIVLRKELAGHVANRLQAALWREAFSLVLRGVVSARDLDAAISEGPGLRWALLGPFANLYLAGGEGGLDGFFRHFGPPIQSWLDDLDSTIRVTPEVSEALTARVTEAYQSVDMAAMVRERDELLVGLRDQKQRSTWLR
jgi:carnitine 3-dehydrogenase